MGVLRNVSHNLFGGYRLCKSCCFDEIFQLIILPFLSQLLKPQVERRRRERMNRSLEGLRHLLLQGVQQEGGAQRRIEKAEILEHTVFFLRNVTTEGTSNREGCQLGNNGFKDGVSACMQRAVRYLGQQEEGLRPEATLDAALVAGFVSSRPASLTYTAKPCSSSPQTNKLLSIRQLIKSRHGESTRGDPMGEVAVSHRSPVQHASPPLRPNQAVAQSLSRSGSSLWRPWP
ncbi:transcription factor HES-2-like isoform X1 [Gadus chalcogrammus]|uniref:transcription factor HES-2-like isoform X1 n=1 Tax=Gadus chalcogrammus TaxID=1042646 RepID=UPI0024C47AD0|nr:transcription factor HES-2-like isoform X1 [Gadus chalcogrammus]